MATEGSVMTLRLDRTMRRRLAAGAKRQRLTPSAAVRQAIEAWIDAEAAKAAAAPYEALADLIGCVAGPPGLSVSRIVTKEAQ